MKTLLITRHAKSSWDNPEWSDFERPLNERGLREAPFMANIVANNFKLPPDLIISSPAMRAATTCKLFAKAFQYNEDNIEFDRNIFERGPKYIIKKLSELGSNLNFVALFGHNPDMTTLYSYFSGQYIDNIPTCGSFCIDFDIESWKEIQDENGEIRWFEYPKKHFPSATNND